MRAITFVFNGNCQITNKKTKKKHNLYRNVDSFLDNNNILEFKVSQRLLKNSILFKNIGIYECKWAEILLVRYSTNHNIIWLCPSELKKYFGKVPEKLYVKPLYLIDNEV